MYRIWDLKSSPVDPMLLLCYTALMRVLFCLFFLLRSFAGSGVCAQESRFSGEPLPRYMSIRANSVNVRVGPGAEYPIKYSYSAAASGIPVLVDNEYHGWYRITDRDEDGGWVQRAALSKTRTALVTLPAVMLSKADDASGAVARLAPGLVLVLRTCGERFCHADYRASGRSYSGYVPRASLFGI